MWLIFLRSEYFIGSFVLAILSFSLPRVQDFSGTKSTSSTHLVI